MPRRHRKNKTMKRGGMWPFDSSSSTPTTSSSSWWGSSSWNPFSSNKPSSSSYSSYGSYGSSPSQPIQPSSYPSAAPDQYQADQGQTGYNQDYNQDYNQQYAGYRRKRQTKNSSLVKYRTLRPSLNRTGGKTRKMSRRRKH